MTADAHLARLKRGGFYTRKSRLIVYTDASYLFHRPSKDMGIGIFWGEGPRADAMLSGERPPPDVRTICHAEFYAVIRAIELHPDPRVSIEIRTDSMAAVGYFSRYRDLRRRGWRKKHNSKKLVGNAVLIGLLERLGRALKVLECQVFVVHVKGHAGDKRNCRADALAKAAARDHLIIDLSDETRDDSDDDDIIDLTGEPDDDEVIVVSDSEGEEGWDGADVSEDEDEWKDVIVISDDEEGEESGGGGGRGPGGDGGGGRGSSVGGGEGRSRGSHGGRGARRTGWGTRATPPSDDDESGSEGDNGRDVGSGSKRSGGGARWRYLNGVNDDSGDLDESETDNDSD